VPSEFLRLLTHLSSFPPPWQSRVSFSYHSKKPHGPVFSPRFHDVEWLTWSFLFPPLTRHKCLSPPYENNSIERPDFYHNYDSNPHTLGARIFITGKIINSHISNLQSLYRFVTTAERPNEKDVFSPTRRTLNGSVKTFVVSCFPVERILSFHSLSYSTFFCCS